MSDVTVYVRRDGPYKIIGAMALVDDETGEPIPGGDGGAVFLCRCGGSTNKPFCDGTHSKIGFQGAMAAVQQAEG
jgi:3-phenylpropionate/trans-cinnamate dioxygenase ferredoxin subunit